MRLTRQGTRHSFSGEGEAQNGNSGLVVWGINSRLGEVLFPAASAQARARNRTGTQQILEVGTRWTFLVAMPLCLILWILAPDLLRAWLGVTSPDAVLVLRLTTLAVCADAIGVGPMHVLWGRGASRAVLAVISGVTVASLGLSLGLLLWIGIVGPAWGVLVPVTFGSLVFLSLASRTSGVRVSRFIRTTFNGMLLPAVACAATASGIAYVTGPDSWPEIIGAALAGCAAYAVSLHIKGAREEERMVVAEILNFPGSIARSGYRWFRR